MSANKDHLKRSGKLRLKRERKERVFRVQRLPIE